MQNQGINFIIEKGAERIDPIDLHTLLVHESNELHWFKIGRGTQEFGLIERLALSGLSGYSEIVEALDTLGSFECDAHSIRRYVMGRWGKKYRIFNDFVEFLKTNFIG